MAVKGVYMGAALLCLVTPLNGAAVLCSMCALHQTPQFLFAYPAVMAGCACPANFGGATSAGHGAAYMRFW